MLYLKLNELYNLILNIFISDPKKLKILTNVYITRYI
jgi:hypothetical protein